MVRREAAWTAAFIFLSCNVASAETASHKPKEKSETGTTASPTAQDIESAKPDSAASNSSPALIARIEILLDRAHFSPGEIDGRDGDNVKLAVSTYKREHKIANPEVMDEAVFQALTAKDSAAVLQHYTIAAADEKGPFLGTVPKDFKALALLKHVGYANPEEGLAEKFHMSPALLRALNPDADFAKTGTALTVANSGAAALPEIVRIEVDKSANQVRAYDSSGALAAAYPATVGSTERPAPSGDATVTAVAPDPDYTYNPSRLTFGPKSGGALKIPPGPNNPVGATWIALSVETYGIHGTPDPEIVGKTASHGCVRLTNWDAVALGKAVKKGTAVAFVGTESQSKPAQRSQPKAKN